RRKVSSGQLGRSAWSRRSPIVRNQREGWSGLPSLHLFIEVYERRELPPAEIGSSPHRYQQRGQLFPLLPIARDHGLVPHRGLWRRLGLYLRYREGRSGPHHRQQHGRKSPSHRYASEELSQTGRTEI